MITRKIFLAFLILFLGFSSTQAQIKTADWTLDKTTSLSKKSSLFKAYPKEYIVADIKLANFDEKLKVKEQEIELPSPDGSFATYIIKPSKVVADEVAHLYTIKTFIGFRKDNPSVMVSCDISDQGFHAAVYEGRKTYFVEPLELANSKHLLYFKRDLPVSEFRCQVEHAISKVPKEAIYRAPTSKRELRLAVVSPGEYSQQFGGSPYSATNVLNALAAGVNMMNPIFLRDLGVEFTLVTTAALVYPTVGTPINISSNSVLSDCHNAIVSAIGVNEFDVGHLVAWTSAAGVASFEVICSNSSKGEGYSGADGSVSQLWVDYAAHELGHQFGSEHNFEGPCNDVTGHRYETGEGSTIMSYAGVCGAPHTYQSFSDPYFHYNSIQQIQTFLNTTSCATGSAAGNTSDPTANAQSDMTIPKQTAFILVGSGSDANDPASQLTYDWVQYDSNPSSGTGAPSCNSTNRPQFRYQPPTNANYRSFPVYSEVLAGNNNGVTWEKLPCVARNMTFSLSVRDNNTNFGRLVEDRMVVTVANTGPFNVTAPNGGESLGSNSTITWTVNGTDSHCANVDILLSTDGGTTYSVLVDGTANDGSEAVTFPTSSTTARILIRCDVAGGYQAVSTFYDVTDGNFSITGGTATCSDGIQNQGETGLDCGGPCPACVTCETHTLAITFDDLPEETTWDVKDAGGATIASGGPYINPNSTTTETFCLDIGVCYDFTIYDEYGDGICCGYGSGSYSVTNASNTVLVSGGDFGTSQTTQICPSNSSGNCYTDLTNSNGLGTNETGIADYESSTYIRTNTATVIQNGAKVDYDATTDIELNANFEVKLGAEFEAFIDGCNNGAGGINITAEDENQ